MFYKAGKPDLAAVALSLLTPLQLLDRLAALVPAAGPSASLLRLAGTPFTAAIDGVLASLKFLPGALRDRLALAILRIANVEVPVGLTLTGTPCDGLRNPDWTLARIRCAIQFLRTRQMPRHGARSTNQA